MNSPIDYNGTWKIRRYDWKKQLGEAQDLKLGAKLLATLFCDKYANHKTGFCWPSNKTLAADLDVDVRSIQRWIRELIKSGWVQRVKLRGRRRGLQLTFPKSNERDNQYDTENDSETTVVSSVHDRRVASYNEPKKNLRNDGVHRGRERSFKYLVITDDETQCFDAWKEWISQHLCMCPERVFEAVRVPGGYCLPSRYPSSDPKVQRSYKKYFQEAMKSKGRMFKR